MSVAAHRDGAAGSARRARTLPIDLPTLAVLALLILMPAFVNRFVLTEVFGLTFAFGIIALSLQFLAGYGGMVNLAQITVAGVAGYMVAVLGPNTMGFGLAWPWWIAIPIALLIAVAMSAAIGLLAIRTDGIYTIMITLAICAAFSYFTFQNYDIFNGYNGVNGVRPPGVFGVDWTEPTAFYYLLLGFAALSYLAALYVSRIHVRPGAAGHSRQRTQDGGDRLQRAGASRRRLRVHRHHRGGGRHPAALAQRAHLARHHWRRRRHRYPDHGRDRRACATRSGLSSAPSFSCAFRPSPWISWRSPFRASGSSSSWGSDSC